MKRKNRQEVKSSSPKRKSKKQKSSPEHLLCLDAEQYTALLKNANDAIFVADAETGLIVNANRKAARLLRRPMKDVIGMHQTELHPPWEAVRYGAIFQDALTRKSGMITRETLFVINSKGQNIPVEISARVIPLNGRKVILGIFRDLSHRRHVEELVRQSEQKYRMVFENSPAGICFFGRGGEVIECNARFTSLLGLTGRRVANFSLIKSSGNRDMKEALSSTLEGKPSCYEGPLSLSCSRKTTPVRINFSPVFTQAKEVIGGVGIFEDITERQRASEKLQKSRLNLEQLVKKRTSELTQINRSLKKEVSERKKAEGMLRDYQKQLQLLASQMALIEEHEKRRIATELHDCIGQTLALSKIKLRSLTKMLPADETKCVVNEILKLIEQSIRETRTLTFELSPPILYELGLCPAIQWLADHFRAKYGMNILFHDQGLHDPFDQKVRFILFGSVRELLMNILKHAQAQQVMIRISQDDENLHILVEDDGSGFSSQGHEQRGFGLFNIRERMNHIHGQFKITTQRGKGTKARIMVPLS